MGIIGSIRKHSWVAVAIVGLAIVAFIIGDLTKNRNSIPDLAKINNTTITSQHFTELTNQMEDNYKMQSGSAQISNEVEQQIREQAWQNLLEETLTGEEFAKLGLKISNAELTDMFSGEFIHPYVRQMFTDPQTGVFNVAQIKQITDNFGQLDSNYRQQWKDLEKYVTTDRLNTKYSNLVLKGFYMPTAIAKKISEVSTNVADVRIVALPLQNVLDEDANPTEEDFKNYYAQHKEEFRIAEEVRELNYVLFPVVPTQADLAKIQEEVMSTWEEFQTTSDEEIAFFVNAESNHQYDSTYMKASQLPAPFDSIVPAVGAGKFIAPMQVGNQWVMAKVVDAAVRPDSMRASVVYVLNDKAGLNTVVRNDADAKLRADSVAAMLKSNKITIEEAVAQYSDDPQKADNGGDLNWLPEGSFGVLNQQMLETAEGGVFTLAFPNNIGYYVVKVTGKTKANQKYRVAIISHEIAPSEATSRNVYNEANKFAGQNRTYQEMMAAAQQQNMPMRNAYSRIMDYNLANITNVRDVIRWAYDEKTKAGDVADQVFETENTFIVVAVKDIYAKGVPELAQMHDQIEMAVRNEKKKEILMARAEEAQKAAKNIDGIAVKLGATIDTVAGVSFNSYYLDKFGMEPKVIAAIAATKSNKLIGPIKGASGVYMVQIDNVQNQPAADVVAIRTNMEQSSMQKMRRLTQILKDRAKVIDQRNKFF